MENNDIMYTINITDQLTDNELDGLLLTLELGNNPKNLPCWDKVEPLFTQLDIKGQPQINDMTEEALTIIRYERLGQMP